MDKIVSALQKMQRLDVINQIKDYVQDLVSVASQHAMSDGQSEQQWQLSFFATLRDELRVKMFCANNRR